MRIIGGSARGRTLIAPRGQQTRPTADAVRESLFNILRAEVAGARVLDLFAGSGALALESLSRGAASAVMVDRAQDAARAIRRNIDHAGFAERCACLCCDWRAALARLPVRAFDLVFLDPPYDRIDLGAVCAALEAAGLLADAALIVAEHRTGAPPALASPSLRPFDARRYGDTTVTLIRNAAILNQPASPPESIRESKGGESADAHGDLSGQL